MSDVNEIGANDPLAGAKTPVAARKVLRELREESTALLRGADVEVGTGEEQTWTLADNERAAALHERQIAAVKAYDERFGEAERLEDAQRGLDERLARAADAGNGAPITAMPEAFVDERTAASQVILRNAEGELTNGKLLLRDGDLASKQAFARAAMLDERATAIAGQTAGAGVVVGALPSSEYFTRARLSAVHLGLVRKRLWPNYAYRAFIQTARPTAAAGVAQGANAPEGTFQYAGVDRTMRRYAESQPITEELMRDLGAVQGMVFEDVAQDIAEKVSRDIVSGAAAGDNLTGLNSLVSGTYTGVTTIPQRRDWSIGSSGVANNRLASAITSVQRVDFIDQIAAAISDVADGGNAMADNITTTYQAWTLYVTAKDNENRYLFRNPSEAGPMMMHGLPIHPTNEFGNAVDNAPIAIVGAFDRFALMTYWGESEMKIGLSGDDLIQGQQTVVGTMRCDVIFGRPNAFSILSIDAS